MHTRRFALADISLTVAATLLTLTAPLRADASTPDWETHIRTRSSNLRSLVAESTERSPLFRSLVDQIQASNVIVYLDYHLFRDTEGDGRLLFLSAAGGRRYVLIQIACLRRRIDEFAILGHELQHAAEVAAAPAVVDAASMASHYRTIGTRVHSQCRVRECYETREAKDQGLRVQGEILASIRAETFRAAPASSPN